MEKIVTVQIWENTRRRLNKKKYELGVKTIDTTINKVMDDAESIIKDSDNFMTIEDKMDLELKRAIKKNAN